MGRPTPVMGISFHFAPSVVLLLLLTCVLGCSGAYEVWVDGSAPVPTGLCCLPYPNNATCPFGTPPPNSPECCGAEATPCPDLKWIKNFYDPLDLDDLLIWVKPEGGQVPVSQDLAFFPTFSKNVTLRGARGESASNPTNASAVAAIKFGGCQGFTFGGVAYLQDLLVLRDSGGSCDASFLLADGGQLTITDCAFEDGAFDVRAFDGASMTVERSSFSGMGGHAVLTVDGSNAGSSLSIANCTFSHNYPVEAVVWADAGSLSITGSLFRGNVRTNASSSSAGEFGVAVHVTENANYVSIRKSSFVDNDCNSSAGCDSTKRFAVLSKVSGNFSASNSFCGNPALARYKVPGAPPTSSEGDEDLFTFEDACGECGGEGNAARSCGGTDALAGSCLSVVGTSQLPAGSVGDSCATAGLELFVSSSTPPRAMDGTPVDSAQPRGSSKHPFPTLAEGIAAAAFRTVLTLAAGVGDYEISDPTGLLLGSAVGAWRSPTNSTGFTIRCSEVGRADLCVVRHANNSASTTLAISGTVASRDLVFEDLSIAGAIRVFGGAAPTFRRSEFFPHQPEQCAGGCVQIAENSWPLFEDCTARDASGDGIRVSAGHVEATGMVFRDIGGRAVSAENGLPRLRLLNCTFVRTGANATALFGGAGGAITLAADGSLFPARGRLLVSQSRFFSTAESGTGLSVYCDNMTVPSSDNTNAFCTNGNSAGLSPPNGTNAVSSVVSCGSESLWSPLGGLNAGWNVSDSCGVCGGNDVALDCAGTCWGKSIFDPASSCCDPVTTDCAGYCDGSHSEDQFETCCRTTIQDCQNVCNGTSLVDCAGSCNGTAVRDSQQVCCTTPASIDCNGTCNGTAVLDKNSACCNQTRLDCEGACDGAATCQTTGQTGSPAGTDTGSPAGTDTGSPAGTDTGSASGGGDVVVLISVLVAAAVCCLLLCGVLAAVFVGRQRGMFGGDSGEELEDLAQRVQALEAAKYGISFSDLGDMKPVGEGNFGVVSTATWISRDVTVAVKQIKADKLDTAEAEEFRREAKLLLSLKPSIHVVQVLGVVDDPPVLCLVMEFMKEGSLHGYLQKHGVAPASLQQSWALGTARGVLHLHACGVLHGDLAARNILLAADLQPKVTDFGLSIRENEEIGTAAGDGEPRTFRGAMRWACPEALLSQNYQVTAPQDVWAFGVLLHEISSGGDLPFKGLTNEQVLGRLLAGPGGNPGVPPNTPSPVADAMRACWAHDPVDRADFRRLVSILKAGEADSEFIENVARPASAVSSEISEFQRPASSLEDYQSVDPMVDSMAGSFLQESEC